MAIATISGKIQESTEAVENKVAQAVKHGLKFVWSDMTKKHLLWVKVVFFLQSASLVTLYPYLVRIATFSFSNITQPSWSISDVAPQIIGFYN